MYERDIFENILFALKIATDINLYTYIYPYKVIELLIHGHTQKRKKVTYKDRQFKDHTYFCKYTYTYIYIYRYIINEPISTKMHKLKTHSLTQILIFIRKKNIVYSPLLRKSFLFSVLFS